MKKSSQGFTIVELIIYTSMLLVLLYIFTTIFSSVLDVQLESQTQSAIVQDSGYMYARFQYDIGRASSIVVPAALGGTSPSMTLRINGNDFVYSVVNGSLQVAEPAGTIVLNSDSTTVSNMSFRKYGNVNGKHSVSIAYTLTSVSQRTQGAETQDFQSTIGLR